MKGALDKLTVKGFTSIKELNELELSNLNVIIGANGSGKSNFIQIFSMMMAMEQKNFSKFILESGGADSFLFNGSKITPQIDMEFEFASPSNNTPGGRSYKFELTPTADEKFLIRENIKYVTPNWGSYGDPAEESRLFDECNEKSRDVQGNGVGHFVYESISKWRVYHFHDTSNTAPMRRYEIVEDYNNLRSDAANIAPFLLDMKNSKRLHEEKCYNEIVNAIRLVIPFFDDFRLDVRKFGESERVRLSWSQKGSDFPMQPYHLSDGSIRFICLATALLQPYPPTAIIIDEPELGLHPAAIFVLSEMIKVASQRTQVVVATQSPALIDQFSLENIVVVNRKNGASTFERLREDNFSEWLENYSLGELWTKNVIVGGPVYE
jgi:predicted ATPase